MKSFYDSWGFNENPFDTRSLEPNEEGEALLVGRDSDLAKLIKNLNNTTKWICIDGGRGQGKTSLANVAIFKQMKEFLTKGTGRFLIPCTSIIEIGSGVPTGDVREYVLNRIARTILAKDKSGNSNILKYCTLQNKSDVDKLFNKPFFSGGGLGVGGLAIQKEISPNETGLFNDTLYDLIENWLVELDESNGAVVCIIDNLDEIGSSSTIADKLDPLRDSLLSKKGIIWILCGANGAVSGMASTKINAHLKKPSFSLGPIGNIKEVVERRVLYFGRDAYLPLSGEDLVFLDSLMSHVLRECLGYIGNYCEWVFDEGKRPESEEDKKVCFLEWLDFMSEDAKKGLAQFDEKKAWGILERGFKRDKFTSQDFRDFKYSQQSNFSKDIKQLETAGLLQKNKSENDGRVGEYSLTPKARLALYKEMKTQC
jgi:hypothetical protein